MVIAILCMYTHTHIHICMHTFIYSYQDKRTESNKGAILDKIVEERLSEKVTIQKNESKPHTHRVGKNGFIVMSTCNTVCSYIIIYQLLYYFPYEKLETYFCTSLYTKEGTFRHGWLMQRPWGMMVFGLTNKKSRLQSSELQEELRKNAGELAETGLLRALQDRLKSLNFILYDEKL